MDQTRAINALAPFLALAKSANSPRAASDLITQATSAPSTYVFQELLQQPNVQALSGHEQYGSYFTLLQCFAWGTWESYKATPDLPPLSDAQALKLRLLSLLTIAAEKESAPAGSSNLSYASLCTRLHLPSSIELEQLVTQAIYNGLITGTINPASETVIVNSVAPLRDLSPGSVQSMVAELSAWSHRCDAVLADLEEEIQKVKSDAEKRAKREARVERQIKGVTEAAEKGATGNANVLGAMAPSRSGHSARGNQRREQGADDDEDYGDAMDVDDGGRGLGGGRKKGSSGGGSNLFGKLTGKGGSR